MTERMGVREGVCWRETSDGEAMMRQGVGRCAARWAVMGRGGRGRAHGDRGSLEWPSSETGHRAAVCSSTGPVWVGSAREGITVLLVCYVGPHS